MTPGLLRTVVLLACLAVGPPAAAQVILSASNWAESTHPLARTLAAWCEDVRAATSGRVRCRILPLPVAPAHRTFEAVRHGLVDIAYSAHGHTPEDYPLARIAELPLLGDSAETLSVAYQRIHDKYLAPFGEHRGLHVLSVFTQGPGMIFNARRPIRRMNDLTGLVFRVGGGMAEEAARALGIETATKPASQVHDLLAARLIDGVLLPAGPARTFGLEGQIRYRTEVPGGLFNTSYALVMNPEAWNRIPRPDQIAIARLAGPGLAARFGRAWDADDRRSLAQQQAERIQGLTASPAFLAQIRVRTDMLARGWIALAEAHGLDRASAVLEELRRESAVAR